MKHIKHYQLGSVESNAKYNAMEKFSFILRIIEPFICLIYISHWSKVDECRER